MAVICAGQDVFDGHRHRAEYGLQLDGLQLDHALELVPVLQVDGRLSLVVLFYWVPSPTSPGPDGAITLVTTKNLRY